MRRTRQDRTGQDSAAPCYVFRAGARIRFLSMDVGGCMPSDAMPDEMRFHDGGLIGRGGGVEGRSRRGQRVLLGWVSCWLLKGVSSWMQREGGIV